MRLIYVDDELPALDNFRLTVASFLDVKSLNVFQNGNDAIEHAKSNKVDVAFLDMEMPGIHGLELARALKAIDSSIKIIFVTAFSQYALDAFSVEAIGYVMKPYLRSEIRKELDKADKLRISSTKRVNINTIPGFSVTVDGEPLHIGREKALELFALLVDYGERGITAGEGVACLWPDRSNDAGAQSLFRMTYKRLADALEKAGVGDILESRNTRRLIRTDLVSCDLYDILSGDEAAAKKYDGRFMQEYWWAEERNGQLYRMVFSKDLWE